MNRRPRFEVIIVGGGPAGLAAAIALQQSGFACAVFDGQHPPVDKACGEGLMPDALAALKHLGIVLNPEDGFPIRGIRFRGHAQTAAATFSHGYGLGLRRTRLHQHMVARAEALGVHFFWKTPVSLASENTIRIGKESLECDWLVLADGQASTLARSAGFPSARVSSKRVAARQHYAIQPWTDCVEVYWGQHKQVYITPVGPGEIGVAVLAGAWPPNPQGERIGNALAEFPSLAERLRHAPVISRFRGAITSNRKLPAVIRRRTILLGDASGSVDAITGEGLAIAFRQALLLADALKASDLRLYAQGHRQLATTPHRMARLLLAMDRWPRFGHAALATVARRPELFRALLDLHTGEGSLSLFARQHGLKLAWQLLCSTRLQDYDGALTQCS